MEFLANLGDYPLHRPDVLPVSVILHPNISYEDECRSICLNVLDEWFEYEGKCVSPGVDDKTIATQYFLV